MTTIQTGFSFFLVALLAAVSGCASSGTGGNRLVSGFYSPLPAGPASSGGVIGRLNGGIVDRGVAETLGATDRRAALEAEYRALEITPSGQAVRWSSRDGAVSGSVVAATPYQVGSQNCRQYTHAVATAQGTRETRGAACRNADGSWTPLT